MYLIFPYILYLVTKHVSVPAKAFPCPSRSEIRRYDSPRSFNIGERHVHVVVSGFPSAACGEATPPSRRRKVLFFRRDKRVPTLQSQCSCHPLQHPPRLAMCLADGKERVPMAVGRWRRCRRDTRAEAKASEPPPFPSQPRREDGS